MRGASRLLERGTAAYLIEVSGDPDEEGTKARLLFDLMSSFGFTPYIVSSGRLRRREPHDRSIDYFFLQIAHVECVKKFMTV
jgi:hypothetical protein